MIERTWADDVKALREAEAKVKELEAAIQAMCEYQCWSGAHLSCDDTACPLYPYRGGE